MLLMSMKKCCCMRNNVIVMQERFPTIEPHVVFVNMQNNLSYEYIDCMLRVEWNFLNVLEIWFLKNLVERCGRCVKWTSRARDVMINSLFFPNEALPKGVLTRSQSNQCLVQGGTPPPVPRGTLSGWFLEPPRLVPRPKIMKQFFFLRPNMIITRAPSVHLRRWLVHSTAFSKTKLPSILPRLQFDQINKFCNMKQIT